MNNAVWNRLVNWIWVSKERISDYKYMVSIRVQYIDELPQATYKARKVGQRIIPSPIPSDLIIRRHEIGMRFDQRHVEQPSQDEQLKVKMVYRLITKFTYNRLYCVHGAKRWVSKSLTFHVGLLTRTNAGVRGIFTIPKVRPLTSAVSSRLFDPAQPYFFLQYQFKYNFMLIRFHFNIISNIISFQYHFKYV
jgi:hypothetical protein